MQCFSWALLRQTSQLLPLVLCSYCRVVSGCRTRHSPTEQDLVHKSHPPKCPKHGWWVLGTNWLRLTPQTSSHQAMLHTRTPRATISWAPAQAARSLLSSVESYFMVCTSVFAHGTAQVSSWIPFRGKTKTQAWFITRPFIKPIKALRKLIEMVNTDL